MYATICVSENMDFFSCNFTASNYEFIITIIILLKYTPDLLARQKSSIEIGMHKLDTRLVVRLSFLLGKYVWHRLKSVLLP